MAAVKLFLARRSWWRPRHRRRLGHSHLLDGLRRELRSVRTVVVMADGENHKDDVVAATAEFAQENGNVTFLAWPPWKVRRPTFDARGNPSGFGRTAGNAVVSSWTTTLIGCQAGQGTYARAGTGFVDLAPLIQFKNELTTARVAAVSFVDFGTNSCLS